ncbi:MAG: hypothetical protein K8H75_07225, partial [Sulfuricella sp.]|nr:hypothetical protein [Sulfuricella sp.]
AINPTTAAITMACFIARSLNRCMNVLKITWHSISNLPYHARLKKEQHGIISRSTVFYLGGQAH